MTTVADPSGKSRLMAAMCSTCVFRPRNPLALKPGRLRELVGAALAEESYIVCHSTLPGVAPQGFAPAICRGFVDRYKTSALQVMGRLWGFVKVGPPPKEDGGKARPELYPKHTANPSK
jgi:hypothetical protein